MRTNTQEKMEGRGQLETWENPEKRIPVAYTFDITTEILARPGFPHVVTRRNSIGKIRGLAGEAIAEGYYRLVASDGEILRIQNVGLGQWVILAS